MCTNLWIPRPLSVDLCLLEPGVRDTQLVRIAEVMKSVSSFFYLATAMSSYNTLCFFHHPPISVGDFALKSPTLMTWRPITLFVFTSPTQTFALKSPYL